MLLKESDRLIEREREAKGESTNLLNIFRDVHTVLIQSTEKRRGERREGNSLRKRRGNHTHIHTHT